MREIRRYTNRKLYDVERSHYATLSDLATLVRDGIEFRVVDRETNRDLTAQTLAEILYTEEKRASRVPIEVLVNVIRGNVQIKENP